MEKTQQELDANYHNSKPANCLTCLCKDKDCFPDDKEQYKWNCDHYEE